MNSYIAQVLDSTSLQGGEPLSGGFWNSFTAIKGGMKSPMRSCMRGGVGLQGGSSRRLYGGKKSRKRKHRKSRR